MEDFIRLITVLLFFWGFVRANKRPSPELSEDILEEHRYKGKGAMVLAFVLLILTIK